MCAWNVCCHKINVQIKQHDSNSTAAAEQRKSVKHNSNWSKPMCTSSLLFTRQDHNGGALKVELDAVGVFQGTVDFTGISIIPTDTGIRRYIKGAALHSKVPALLWDQHPMVGESGRGFHACTLQWGGHPRRG